MKRNFKIAVVVAFLLSAVMMIQCSDKRVSAYILNGYRFKNPRSVGICSNSEEYGTRIRGYAKKWNVYSALHLVDTNLTSAKITATVYDYNKEGVYAETSHNSTTHSIVFYSAWIDTDMAKQNEIIVHEFGHAVGLAHCAPRDVNEAVMRATGFNGYAYPLSDDKAGIRALYK